MEADKTEAQLFFNAEVGNFSGIQTVLRLRAEENISLNVNCKCK